MNLLPFFYKKRFLLASVIVVLLLTSCTGHIGYGVINWSIPEHSLTAGDVVPVFIRSNISKVYVIGLGKGGRTHVEVPIWQLTLYKSKSQAEKAARGLEEYRYTYASVKLDGLPIRASPENTAKQVYRLREDQKVKILRKGEGVPVFVGKSQLDGDWYEVITDDGSEGWCFSYNLSLYDERDTGSDNNTPKETGPDPVLQNLLASAWYPDSYRTMIETNRIDIDRINPAWGFFPGRDSGIARIENTDGIVSFPYDSITRTEDGFYSFVGSSLAAQVRRENILLVQYTDTNGMPQALYFCRIGTTPDVLIATEKERRTAILDSIRNAGPLFSSGNYGVLQFPEVGRFLWSGYQLLVPTIIPDNVGGSGDVEIRCFLGNHLTESYDGVLSFRFDSSGKWIHFLYTLNSQGLKLEYVSTSNIHDAVIDTQNLDPTVVFFKLVDSAQDGH